MMVDPKPNLLRASVREWLPVFVIMLIAMAFRMVRTSSPDHYLLAGADGPYLALQVRSLVEHGRLAFPDMPGLFLIDALVARILQVLHVGDINSCVLISIRAMDILLPPLAAIPVFLLVKEFLGKAASHAWPWFMVAFAVLGFTPLFVFSYQLQKNAVGVVWMFAVLLMLVRFLRSRRPRHILFALLFLLGCALTHFGSFIITVVLGGILLLFDPKGYADRQALLSGKKILSLVFMACLALGIVAIFDTQRSWRLLKAPMQLFDMPVIMLHLHGGNAFRGGMIPFIIMNHLLCGIAMVMLVVGRQRLTVSERCIGWAMTAAALILSSPLLGLEWANRCYLMAYVPLTVLWALLLSTSGLVWWKRMAAAIMSLMLLISMGNAWLSRPFHALQDEAFAAFRDLGRSVEFESQDAVVARQDLRLLANWTFRVHGVSPYLLTKTEYGRYHRVYEIKEIPRGYFVGARDDAPMHQHDEELVYQNRNFHVYRFHDFEGLPTEPEKIFRGVRGKVMSVAEGKMMVLDETRGITRTVWVKWPSSFDPQQLLNREVVVNGSWRPFNVDIVAEQVTLLN